MKSRLLCASCVIVVAVIGLSLPASGGQAHPQDHHHVTRHSMSGADSMWGGAPQPEAVPNPSQINVEQWQTDLGTHGEGPATEVSHLASPTGDGAQEVCTRVDEDGRVLVGVFPGPGTNSVTESVSLLEGSTLKLVLCNGDRAVSGWRLSNHPGFEVIRQSETTMTIRITGETYPVRIELAQRNIPGIEVTDPRGTAGNSIDPNLDVSGELHLDSEEALSEYRTAESDYLDARSSVLEALESLNATSEGLASGNSLSSRRSEVDQSLQSLDQSITDLNRHGDGVRQSAFEVARTNQQASTAIAIIRYTHTQEQTFKSRAKAEVTAYLNELDSQAVSAKSSIAGNFKLGVALGGIVGIVIGGLYPVYAAREFKDRAQYTADVHYGITKMLVPVGGGIVVILLTLGIMYLLGGIEILGVIL